MATNKDKKTDKKADKKILDKNNKTENQGLDTLKSRIKDMDIIIKEYNVPLENISARIVLEKMMDVLEHYIKITIQILQPEDFTSLHECTIFDDAEKSGIFSLYKDAMILHREMLKSLIKNDHEDTVKTILYAHSEIKTLKPLILNIVQKMQDSWKKTSINGRIRYFG